MSQEVLKRVKEEKSELDGKLEKLQGFIKTQVCFKLPALQQRLLVSQLWAMQSYSTTLRLRIHDLESRTILRETYGVSSTKRDSIIDILKEIIKRGTQLTQAMGLIEEYNETYGEPTGEFEGDTEVEKLVEEVEAILEDLIQ